MPFVRALLSQNGLRVGLALTSRMFARLATAIRTDDPLVRDAVLTGSAVYSPRSAHDLDSVISINAPRTERQRLRENLLARLSQMAVGRADVIIRSPGEDMGDLAVSLRAGQAIFDNGETIGEAARFFEEKGGILNSFEEAKAELNKAKEDFSLAAGIEPAIHRSVR